MGRGGFVGWLFGFCFRRLWVFGFHGYFGLSNPLLYSIYFVGVFFVGGGKRVIEGRKRKDKDTFQLKTLFMGLKTIRRARKFNLKPI